MQEKSELHPQAGSVMNAAHLHCVYWEIERNYSSVPPEGTVRQEHNGHTCIYLKAFEQEGFLLQLSVYPIGLPLLDLVAPSSAVSTMWPPNLLFLLNCFFSLINT